MLLWGRRGRPHVAAVLAYVVITLAVTWPLVSELGAVVPRDLGDPLLSTWTLWWNARVVPFSAAWWNGPMFHPATGTLAFSDHRAGISLFTTPLIWCGLSPLTAYGAAFLATFVASAVAAYALALAVTGRRAAAFVAGLVFGFHPFRAAHLEHLELLASFWVPLSLLALHRWHGRRTNGALAAVAFTLTMQALTSGYYFAYGSVLIAGWLVWFEARRLTLEEAARLLVALLTPVAVIAPVLWRYRHIHAEFGFVRSITDIEQLSADLADFVAAPDALRWWNTPMAPSAERALFPGLCAVLLVGAGLLVTWRRSRGTVSAPARAGAATVRRVCLWLALAAGVAALIPAVSDGVGLTLGPFTLSIRAVYKPLSLAALLLAGWALSSARIRAAWAAASPFAFYVLATLAMWSLALGPTARVLGHRVFYKAPYAWLMTVPGFADAFRAPARFAMLAALTSSVAAALAMARLRIEPGRLPPTAAWLGVAALALADGWFAPLPLLAPPAALAIPADLARDAVVLELPLGVYEDAAALYRSIEHGRRIVNGLSGYEPPHYTVLKAALRDGDLDVLPVLAASSDITVFVAATPDGTPVAARLRLMSWAVERAATATHTVFTVRRTEPGLAAPGASSHTLPTAATATSAPHSAGAMLDGDLATVWVSASPQQGGEGVVLDLGRPAAVRGVTLDLGSYVHAYPRQLRVEASTEGRDWREVWNGRAAPAAMTGALEDPLAARLTVAFASIGARYLRLTQLARADHPWAIAEIAVAASPP